MPQTKTEKQWTILSLIEWSEKYLLEKDIASPRLSAELLLASVLNYNRIQLYTKFDQPLLNEELNEYKKLFLRRLEGEPLQYITGETEFYGRSFKVNPSVLIPRPETEHIIEAVSELYEKQNGDTQRKKVLDVGVGSGVIAISLVLEHENFLIKAVDLSSTALSVARENAQRYHVQDRIIFEQLDILNDKILEKGERFNFIVSNPPYISKGQFVKLPAEIRMYEPMNALTDNSDGYTYFRRLADLAPKLLNENGWLITEVGYNQADTVVDIYKKGGTKNVRVWKDLAGILRIVGGSW